VVIYDREDEAMNHSDDTRLVRTGELMRRLGVSRTTLYRWTRDGRLPPRRNLSGRTVGWLSSEIEDYLRDPDGWRAKCHGEA
jgi:excisionase family DNA binding protein